MTPFNNIYFGIKISLFYYNRYLHVALNRIINPLVETINTLGQKSPNIMHSFVLSNNLLFVMWFDCISHKNSLILY